MYDSRVTVEPIIHSRGRYHILPSSYASSINWIMLRRRRSETRRAECPAAVRGEGWGQVVMEELSSYSKELLARSH